MTNADGAEERYEHTSVQPISCHLQMLGAHPESIPQAFLDLAVASKACGFCDERGTREIPLDVDWNDLLTSVGQSRCSCSLKAWLGNVCLTSGWTVIIGTVRVSLSYKRHRSLSSDR
jgi:hypothetical protein